MLFAAYVDNPHADAFAAPAPFADALTAMSCLVMFHNICVKQSSMAIPLAHGPGMALTPNNGQYPHTNHGLTQ